MINSRYDSEKHALHCVFNGKMDAASCPSVAQEFEEAWRKAQEQCAAAKAQSTRSMSIVFDLAEVTFVASAFLRICLQAAKRVCHDSFKISNTSPAIQKIMKIAGLDHFTQS